jgi:2-isopropylmalate synthase
MRPEAVGLTETRLVLGKHSGRHAFGNRLAELGYPLASEEVHEVFADFKQLADRKKVVTDADLIALVSAERRQPPEVFSLVQLQVGCGTAGVATAAVILRGPDGAEHTRAAFGSGPVDAAFKAMDEIARAGATLLEYRVHAVTEGIDALGEVTVRVADESLEASRQNPQSGSSHRQVFHGYGADTDVVVASARAYLAALNRLLLVRESAAQASAEKKEAV